MISIKRTIGFLTAAIIIGTSIPAQSANPQRVPVTNRSLITASPYYQQFNPLNGPAQVTLSVTGSTALDVRARIFRSHRVTDAQAAAGIICDDNPTYKVADLVTPYSQLATGSHVVSWSGMMNARMPAGDGAYCYRVEWTNAAAGVRNLVQGSILVDSTIAVNRGNGGNGNNGNGNNNGGNNNGGAVNNNGGGGQGNGAAAGNSNNGGFVWGGVVGYPTIPVQSTTSTQEPTGPSVTFGIDPQDIYPESSTQNTAIISYRVNETLPQGLTVALVDSRNVELRKFYTNTGRQNPTSTSVSWNGRSQLTGRAYAFATYSVVFKTNGREFARGNIRTHGGNAPSNNGNSGNGNGGNGNGGGTIINNPGDISVRVHPTTIYPTSNNPSLNTTQLDYQVKRTLTNGLTIHIFGTNGIEQKKYTITTGSLRPVSSSVNWNGRNNNGSIDYGSHRYTFTSGNTELASGYIQVSRLANPGPVCCDPIPDPICCDPAPTAVPVITNYGANPASFVQGGSTAFSFKVSQNAISSFTIYQNNKKVVTLLNPTTLRANEVKYLTWTTNTPGIYTYTIEAYTSRARAIAKSGSFTVTKKTVVTPPIEPPSGRCYTNGRYDFKKCPIVIDPPVVSVTNMNISDVSVTWTTTLSPVLNFTLNQDANVSVSVRPSTTTYTTAVSVISNTFFSKGTHHYPLSAGLFPDRGSDIGYSYYVQVVAKSIKNSTTDTEYALVSQAGLPVAPPPVVPPVPTGCGSFTDVPVGHPLCAAIDFVSSRGIFAGYDGPNGTKYLGLNRPIQRAEFLAVVQKGFRFSLDPYSSMTDGALGYRDLFGAVGQWFMPYVKTFSRLNIMVGYPDHTMLPGKTIGTAEFLVSFFQAAEKSPYAITRYRINRQVNQQPYADTPMNRDTEWYMGYAAFAKMHNLIPGDYMNPGRGITRGQVIDFIYQTYQKGIIGYGADVLNPTYPAQTYQDYTNFNNSPTVYPYVAPVIDNNYYDNTNYNGYAQSQYVGGYDPNYGGYNQNTDYARTPVYTDPQYTDPNSYGSSYGSNWLWQ